MKSIDWWKILRWTLVTMLCCFLLFGGKIHIQLGRQSEGTERDSTTYVDTIPFYYPVPKDSIVIRYVTARLPVSSGNRQQEFIPNDSNIVAEKYPDSADVEIPITQKVYKDSAYTAYISGYRPNLDSLFVFPKTTVIHIRDKPKRFSVGVGAGYGVGKHGFTPCLNVSVQYKLFEF